MLRFCHVGYLVIVLGMAWSLGSLARADSPETAPDYTIDSDIFYLPEEESAVSSYARETCRLDLYRPTKRDGFATVIFFHSGSLMGGHKAMPPELREHGWAVVGVGYRLHPQVQHPVYLEDAAAAVAWVFQHIAEHGGDPNKIFLCGTSAGGYLTAMIGLDKNYLDKHGIDANRLAGLIPVTGQMITHETIRTEQGITPAIRPTIDVYAPLYHIRADAPPMLCISGGWGVDRRMRAEENLYFVSMMKLAGHTQIEHLVIEGATHRQCGQQCWPHVIAFLEKRLATMAEEASHAPKDTEKP